MCGVVTVGSCRGLTVVSFLCLFFSVFSRGTGVIMVIDFGFAKKIDKKVLKKRGPEPNINLTLWHMHRQLRFYKIMGPLLAERVSSYMQSIK